jgi:hypothetical protein
MFLDNVPKHVMTFVMTLCLSVLNNVNMFSFQTECSTDGGHLVEPDTPANNDRLVAFLENRRKDNSGCKFICILYLCIHFQT